MNNAIILTGNNEIQEAPAITYELYARFIDYIDAKPKTIQTYTRALKQFIVWLNVRGIDRPQYLDVKAYRDELLKTCKPTTVQGYIFAVRRFFEWTDSEGIYPNVAGKIKGAKLNREPKKDYLTAEQVKAVLSGIDRSTAQGIRDYAILTLMVTAGLRDIEVSRANIDDLRAVGGKSVLYVQGKGRDEKAEYIIIPEQTERAVRDYIKTRGRVTGSEPLFTSDSNNSKGKALTTRSISGICKKAMINAGLDSDRLTAHSLRHTAVTLALISNGGNLQEAQQFARHTNVSTTEIYAHNLEKQNNKCSNLIANSIFN